MTAAPGIASAAAPRTEDGADAPSAIGIHAVSHRFGDTRVLDGVSFDVPRGALVGLVGENGAGKSTLFNILSGLLVPTAGRLSLNGLPFAPRSYREAVLAGVSRVFQEQALIPGLTVYENLLLGHERRFERFGIRDRRAMTGVARRIAEAAEIEIDVRRPAGDFPFHMRQRLEIARACLLPGLLLGLDDAVVLLDEPSSALSLEDEAAFFRLLQRLKGHATLVLVSHRLTEVLALADVVHVLKDGALVGSRRTAATSEAELHRLMVGRERTADYYSQSGPRPDAAGAAVTVDGLSAAGSFQDVSFAIAAGEIVGLGGLVDSGKSRLARAVAGRSRTTAGSVRVTPAAGRDAAAGYVPAERLAEGAIATLPVGWNIGLASGDQLSTRLGLWKQAEEDARAAAAIATLHIRCEGPRQRLGALSGGNQQKAVIARWAMRQPGLLVLDNPTRGVDAGARHEIYAILRRLAADGAAVLFVSDDLPELIGLSDRILVLRGGRLVAERPAPADAKPGEEELVALMLGGGGAEPRETDRK